MSASKVKIGADQALEVVLEASEILASSGKKLIRLKLKEGSSKDEILALLLGPTGNLRAPTLRVGKKVLVGFSEEAYEELF